MLCPCMASFIGFLSVSAHSLLQLRIGRKGLLEWIGGTSPPNGYVYLYAGRVYVGEHEERQMWSRPFLAIGNHWRTVVWVIFNPSEVRMLLTALRPSDYKVGDSFGLIGVRVHVPAHRMAVLLDFGERE